MIKQEDLTETDCDKLFLNQEIQSEIWRYYEIKGIAKDRYLFSSTGRCYDFLTKEFVKLYLFKGEGSYWYLETDNKKEKWERVMASDILRKVFFKNGYGKDVRESLDDSVKFYSSRIEFLNKIIKDYKKKREIIVKQKEEEIKKLNDEIKFYDDIILSEQYKINNTVSLLNTLKKATE